MNGIGYLVGLRHALQRHDGLYHVLEVRVESCFVRVHGAGYPGRTDGVDADAVGGVVDCCSRTSGFRDPNHGMFCSGVGRFPGKRDDGVRGAEIHNAPASERALGVAALVGDRFLQEHGASDGAVAEECAARVGVEDVVEFGEGEGGEGGGRAGADLVGGGC
ncbi:hypothetical protein BTUL_0094g00090 [Botrytis tulipae]|uniref:Uncharacterized protein n=1 Tax=Botrytis tulipae TaxID=87230 RepID=A0A4Z1ET99_9HELO|nr:hypothetical protein BTUL_0094g00090 [Botrytis tulipae]